MKNIIILLVFSLLFISCGEVKDIENSKKNVNFTKQFFDQISILDFKKELKNSDIFLIDVRTSGELLKFGKIRHNQRLIDINKDDFIERINSLDKSKKYIIYCWHGNRSATAREFMKENGFSYVKDLKGGIDAWIENGENVVK